MTVPAAMLKKLCPMHVLLDETGHIVQAGPTMFKLDLPDLMNMRFLEAFEIYRPRAVTSMEQLLATEGRKLHLRLRNSKRTQLKGVVLPNGKGGAVVNLSFGIAVVDAVRDYALTSTDFAPTDLTVEMLYLVEAQSVAMNASLRLNTRLHGAKTEAEERAFTDGLTGLRNRRAVDRILDRLCENDQPFALMHLDLDFFKEVNDTYGHAAGDAVLKHVAEVMLGQTRKNDTVGRVGGDEFVIIMNNLISPDRLAKIASRLIETIEVPVAHDGRDCRVSASIGISLKGIERTAPDRILEEADMALYASKRGGRGQFSFFAPTDRDERNVTNSAIAGE